jgi:hypothetical protein
VGHTNVKVVLREPAQAALDHGEVLSGGVGAEERAPADLVEGRRRRHRLDQLVVQVRPSRREPLSKEVRLAAVPFTLSPPQPLFYFRFMASGR